MAEDQDESSKTEEATARKLADAHERGEVARSQEINHWFVLGSGTLAIALFSVPGSRMMTDWLTGFISNAGTFQVAPATLLELMREVGFEVLLVLGLPFLFLIVGALAGELIQHRPVFTTERMTPNLAKISPLAGAKRLFSLRGLAEFAKGLLKIVAAGVAITYVVWPERHILAATASWSLIDVLDVARALSLRILMAGLAVLAVIAALDYFYQRFSFMRDQRMTRQEVMDEAKQQDGDPMVKARLRQIRMERSRRRMMAAVPSADVVITNPTHYAVALKYDQTTMGAPRVVAKGVDAVAARIREIATEAGVPLVENPPLARALHAAVEVDQEIQPEHYRAVAEVIGYVMKLKGRLKPAGPAGPR
jgi:flagellar biosynthetic protein FlhB